MATCFVIGPIGDKFAPFGSPGRTVYEEALDVFEKVISPACAANELVAVRADQIAVTGEITDQVFRHLFEDDVVIADVSGGNANVMYELGLRHTRDLLTVQIGEYGQLPFDVQSIRTIQFSRSARGLIDARNDLTRALSAGLTEGPDILTATRIWSLGESLPVPRVVDQGENADGAGVDDLDRDGFLEQMAGIESKFPELTDTVEKVSALIELMGAEGGDSSSEMEAMNASGASSAARLLYVRKYAASLQARADEMQELATEFSSEMQSISSDVSGIIQYISEDSTNLDDPAVSEFLDNLSDLAESSRDGFESLGQFAQSVRSLGPVSKSLRKPTQQISASIKVMADAAALMDDWDAAAKRVRRHAKADPTMQFPGEFPPTGK